MNAAKRRSETIIVVDDDIINLVVAKNNIAKKYHLFTAPSGQKLFKLLEKVLPDLILLDVEMPEMNGYEVLKKLKGEERTAGIPVIFLTAKMDSESEAKGRKMGAADYITKPFSGEQLLNRIEIQLEKTGQK